MTLRDDSYSVNDFLPNRKMKKVQTGSELLLIYFLRKYTLEMFGKELKLGKGVTIDRSLRKSPYFSFLVDSGIQLDYTVDRNDLASYAYMRLLLFTELFDKVVFLTETDEKVQFVYSHAYSASMEKLPNGTQFSMAYVSLVAYVLVRSKFLNKKPPHIVIGSESYIQKEGDYTDIMVLRDYGNEVLSGMLTVEVDKSWYLQPTWEAFVLHKQQLGYMNAESTTQEKYKYATEDFQVGDVLLRYTRIKGNKSDPMKRLKTCFPCVIRNISDKGVLIEYFPVVKTQLTAHMDMEFVKDTLEENGSVEGLLTPEDYNRWQCTREFLSYDSFGLDKLSFDEDTLLLKFHLPMTQDGTFQYVRDAENPNISKRVFMDTLNTTYAVLQDRKVDYNDRKFVMDYFTLRGLQPMYNEDLYS